MEAFSKCRLEEDLAKVTSAGLHLLAVINDILDLSKIEAEWMELADEPVDITQVLRDAVAAVSRQAEARGGNRISHPELNSPVLVRGDFLRLRQVFINLLSNAVKFTDHGDVTVDWETDSDEAVDCPFRIRISDTGVGISSEHLPLLSEKFRQVDSSPTRRYGGAGLGLAISKRLMTLMGGRITVVSELGKGSTFTVHLRKG